MRKTLASLALALTLTTGGLWALATFTDIPPVAYAACNAQCCDGKSSCSSDIQGCYCDCACDHCFCRAQEGGGSSGSPGGDSSDGSNTNILQFIIDFIKAIAEIFK